MVRKKIVKRWWVVPPRGYIWVNGKKKRSPRKPYRVTYKATVENKKDVEKAARERARQRRGR